MARKEFDDEMRGAAFKNDRKTKGDNRPNYTGTVQIEGTEYWVSVWIQEAKSGKREGEKFLSFAFNEKDEDGGSRKSSRSKPSRQEEDPAEDFDDEIPFD